jgi:hypothetical protein
MLSGWLAAQKRTLPSEEGSGSFKFRTMPQTDDDLAESGVKSAVLPLDCASPA